MSEVGHARRRSILLSGAFLAALLSACAGIPLAGSDLSSDRYPERYPDYDRAYDDEREWESREHKRYSCGEIRDRIRLDREKIATIDPSKHHKALQWYRDDLSNAERDMDRCRGEWGRAEEERQDEWRARERRDHERRDQQREQCAKIEDRIRFDREKIATTDPSKHHKALQWYKDDLRNAERDRQNCRRF
jgi:DNA repair ATPase RecN